jgi:catechol 2,3-dioxygenase-like lactoylglutathione lyase family enzyme
LIRVERTNTILYCRRWADTVAFYRDRLGLPEAFANDWFVELMLGPDSFLSVADAARASIPPGDGAGITLSWQVRDVEDARARLIDDGVEVGEIGERWGAAVLDLYDPEGNRVELWSERRED